MGRYIIRRLLWLVVSLLVISFVTFLIFYLLPAADPAAIRAGRNPNPEQIAAIRAQLGLDDPWYVQYWTFLKALVLHFDIGYSYETNTPVRQLIGQRLPATVSLTLGAVVVWLAVGLTVGAISATRPRSLLDRVTMSGALLAISAPVYWLGLIALYLFSKGIGVVPIFDGQGSYVPLTENPAQWLGSLILPWLVLAAAFAAFYARLLRSNLIETLGEDYIRTARAKGLRERRVVVRHGIRSALNPVVTVLGLDIGTLLGGVILTESVFNIPGIGRLAFDSIIVSDYPAIQGTVLVAALAVVVANLVVDVAYAFLDPRVRYA